MSNDPRSRRVDLRPRIVSPWIAAALTALGVAAAIHASWTLPAATLPVQAGAFMIGFLAVSTAVALILAPRNFVAGWLIGLLALLMGWRIAGLLGVTSVAWALLPAFAAYVAQFFDALWADARWARTASWATRTGRWRRCASTSASTSCRISPRSSSPGRGRGWRT
ncbi:MAG: hypothetical protein H0T41_05045 [Rhodobacteraceae bacterium]|nr:hypothetical protein [Paracoccaceae bacterium]